jgi:GT2 family glycosyltransferase
MTEQVTQPEVPLPRVVTVIVTYGDRQHLLQAVVNRLLRLEQFELIEQIIVVDNCSTHPTQSYLADLENSPTPVNIIRLPENLGSAEGFRAGLKAAAQTNSEYVWLLDDDNLPNRNALTVLVNAARRYPARTAFLSLRMDRPQYVRYAMGDEEHKSFGRTNNFLGFSWKDIPRKLLRFFKSRPTGATIASTPRAVPYAPYGGFFFPLNIIHEAGLPRSDYFLYGDDHEYSYRIRQAGVPILLMPESRLIDIDRNWHTTTLSSHFCSPFIITSLDPNLTHRLYYTVRNRARFEMSSLVNNSAEYFFNAGFYISALAMLSFSASLTRLSKVPLTNFWLLVSAVRDGWGGSRGRKDGF